MAYLMKGYIMLVPLMYILLIMIIATVTMLMKMGGDIDSCKDFFQLLGFSCFFSGAYALISFGCSAFEGPKEKDGKDDLDLEINFRLRPFSKAVYAIVLIAFALYFGFEIAPGRVII